MSIKYNGKTIAGKYKAQIVSDATETDKGLIRIATEQEVTTGTDNTTAVTPKKLSSELAKKQDKLTAGTGIEIKDNVISNTQTSAEWGKITGTLTNQTDLNTALGKKQDKLTFDTTPTANSTNPVTSGGIKTALDGTVKTTGNQTVAGVKTFSSTPVITSTALNINNTNDVSIQKQATNFIRKAAGGQLVLSGSSNSVYLRANGDTNTSGQVEIKTDGSVNATKFVGALQGNAATATKATQDSLGNVIKDKYMPIRYSRYSVSDANSSNIYIKLASFVLPSNAGNHDISQLFWVERLEANPVKSYALVQFSVRWSNIAYLGQKFEVIEQYGDNPSKITDNLYYCYSYTANVTDGVKGEIWLKLVNQSWVSYYLRPTQCNEHGDFSITDGNATTNTYWTYYNKSGTAAQIAETAMTEGYTQVKVTDKSTQLALTTKANTSLDNLTDSGKQVIKDTVGLQVQSFTYGMSTYKKGDMSNASWLKSEGQWSSGEVYSGLYSWVVEQLNNQVPNFKGTTGYCYSNSAEAWSCWLNSNSPKVGDICYGYYNSVVLGKVTAVTDSNNITILESLKNVSHTLAYNSSGNKTDTVGNGISDSEFHWITPYDWIVDTTNKRFRLPLNSGERILVSSLKSNSISYFIYNDGWFIQNGVANIPKLSAAATGTTTVYCQRIMADTSYTVTISTQNDPGNSWDMTNYKISKTTTTFDVGFGSKNYAFGGIGSFQYHMEGQLAEGQWEKIPLYYYAGNTIQNPDLININKALPLKADTSLSNLTEEGEKHFLNKTQISNCLTEVPQRINYTIASGTLTLKAGSVVIVPYGTEDLTSTYPKGATFLNDSFKVYDSAYTDGKFFVWAELMKDIASNARTTTDTSTRLCYVNISASVVWGAVNHGSGATTPSDSRLFYNTTTNKATCVNNGTADTFVSSFPFAITVADGSTVFSSISQVFNGVGYIGNVAWIDKGIKGLIANGLNDDGSYKSVAFETPFILRNFSNATAGLIRLIYDLDGTDYTGVHLRVFGYDVYFNSNANKWVNTGTGIINSGRYIQVGEIALGSGGVVTSLDTPHTASLAEKVNKSGDTMHGKLTIDSMDSILLNLQTRQLQRNVTPSVDTYPCIEFQDKNQERLARVEIQATTAGLTQLGINYKHPTKAEYSNISIGYDANGNKITSAPACSATGSIVTTAGISKNVNGYLKMGNGIIVQWGRVTGLGNNSSTRVSFPVSFTAHGQIAVSTSTDSYVNTAQIENYTVTGFTMWNKRSYSSSTYSITAQWIAVGF